MNKQNSIQHSKNAESLQNTNHATHIRNTRSGQQPSTSTSSTSNVKSHEQTNKVESMSSNIQHVHETSTSHQSSTNDALSLSEQEIGGPSSRTRSSKHIDLEEEKSKKIRINRAVYQALNTGQRTKLNGEPLPPNKMALIIRDMDDNFVEFYVKPTTPLSPTFVRFLQEISRTRQEVRFLFDGIRLSDIDTPADKEMISGDSIDCIWSVTGGNSKTTY